LSLAAHCVHPNIIRSIKLVGVRLGEWNLATNPDCDDSFVNENVCNFPHFDAGIEELIIHEQYKPLSFNQHNDIALIRLSQRLRFNEFIKPICLKEAATSLIGQSAVITGFGKTEKSFSSNVKLKATLNIVENDRCNRVFRTEGRRLNASQICAGGMKNLDSCR
jgi:Trypsin